MKSAVNDITKQKIRSRPFSSQYAENLDKVVWTKPLVKTGVTRYRNGERVEEPVNDRKTD